MDGMVRILLTDASKIPRVVDFKNIREFERMEERFFDVEQFYGDIVGMNIDSVEFCPNNTPPEKNEEVLPWLWLIHPEWKDEILEVADSRLKEIIHDYLNDGFQ